MKGEEKWRPDRTGTPEAREIKRGRREGLSGKSGRGAEGDRLAHSGQEAWCAPKLVSPLQSPIRAAWVLGP